MTDLATRQGCKVFVGGLSWETTGEKLRSYFENYGVVREAFVSYNRNNGRPRGFGFVVFESSDVADKVVASKHTIDRREVEAKKALPKDEQLQQDQALQQSDTTGNAKCKKIFVGGLAPTVDDKVLRQYFETFGAVEDAVVMYDHDNKRPRGFGFVTFAADDSVDSVFAKGAMQTIQDKQIEIKSAVPRDLMPATATARPAQGFFDPRFMGGQRAGAYPSALYGAPLPGMPGHFGSLQRSGGVYPGSRGTAPTAQAQVARGPPPFNAGQAAAIQAGFHKQNGAARHGPGLQNAALSAKVPPMAAGYGLYAGGNGTDMFGSNPQAALAAYNLASLQQAQAQLNGMSSAPAAAAGKLNANAFSAANNLNLKALALAGSFGAAFPSGQGSDASFQDDSNNFQQQPYVEAAATAASNLNAVAAAGLAADYGSYHDASFTAAPAPGWSS